MLMRDISSLNVSHEYIDKGYLYLNIPNPCFFGEISVSVPVATKEMKAIMLSHQESALSKIVINKMLTIFCQASTNDKR